MQHLAGMRLESNHGRHGAGGARSCDHRLHDQLMAKMQTIEHAQRQNRGARDVGVVGAVKKTHRSKDEGGRMKDESAAFFAWMMGSELPASKLSTNPLSFTFHPSSFRLHPSSTSPSYAHSTPSGSSAESRACFTSCVMCVRYARCGFNSSMYARAFSNQRCVSCGRIR